MPGTFIIKIIYQPPKVEDVNESFIFTHILRPVAVIIYGTLRIIFLSPVIILKKTRANLKATGKVDLPYNFITIAGRLNVKILLIIDRSLRPNVSMRIEDPDLLYIILNIKIE